MKKIVSILTFIFVSFSLDSIVSLNYAQFTNQSQTIKDKINSDNGFTIDPRVKKKVKKRIGKKVDTWKDGTPLYSNLIIMELYKNDTLAFSKKEKDNFKNIFNSYYNWKGDTLFIGGSFGLPRAEGFLIRLIKGKATLYHTLFSRDIYPRYAYTEKGEVEWSIEVECEKNKIILSDIPERKNNKAIYGYVEFKTSNYYACNLSDDGKENMPRTKQSKEMRIYFVSGYYQLPK